MTSHKICNNNQHFLKTLTCLYKILMILFIASQTSKFAICMIIIFIMELSLPVLIKIDLNFSAFKYLLMAHIVSLFLKKAFELKIFKFRIKLQNNNFIRKFGLQFANKDLQIQLLPYKAIRETLPALNIQKTLLFLSKESIMLLFRLIGIEVRKHQNHLDSGVMVWLKQK